MREQIAVLDGLSMLADGAYAGQSYTPEPAEGANLIGGSNWFDRAPTLPSSEGLAGGGFAGLGSLSMDPVGGWGGGSYSPEPGEGALYQGGSNWHPYAPTRVSAEGLAGSLAVEPVPGWAGESITPVPGGGQNYTGGSDWSRRFPTRVSSNGLVGAHAMGYAPPPWRFPKYDERERRVSMLLGCGAMKMFKALLGVYYPLEVRNCVETVMSRLRARGQLEQTMAASAADIAYLGALYVADKHTSWMGWRGADARTRARAVAQRCG